MKKLILITTAMATLLGSCTRECGPCPGAISQIFVHTYGVETSKKDWETRGRNGQIVTTRKDLCVERICPYQTDDGYARMMSDSSACSCRFVVLICFLDFWE